MRDRRFAPLLVAPALLLPLAMSDEPTAASVSGVAWEDQDGNAARDPGERGVGGVTIYIDANNNGQFDDAEPATRTIEDDPDTATDEAGTYWLEGIEPGHHVVREVVPDGFVQTFPLRLGHTVDLEPGQTLRGVDFGNQRATTASVMGTAWNDRNGNGSRGRNEPGIGGVIVYSDLNQNGVLDPDEPATRTIEDDPDTVADEAGTYRLESLEPGRHIVRQVVPDGFVQTFPLGLGHTVDLPPDQTLEGLDFGNRRQGRRATLPR